jgi:hypothetical protein
MFSFLNDGYARAVKGIRAEIEAKYAERHSRATGAERKSIGKAMQAEIKQAIEQLNLRRAVY